jgi:hypothetical protein
VQLQKRLLRWYASCLLLLLATWRPRWRRGHRMLLLLRRGCPHGLAHVWLLQLLRPLLLSLSLLQVLRELLLLPRLLDHR